MLHKVIHSLIVIYVLLFIGCTEQTNYESLVKNGLESGIQADSLFLGYYFGMDRQEFLTSSWEMNQQGIMTGQTKIEYKLEDLKSRITMLFYPAFVDNKIASIPVTYGYDSWAPWNEEFWPESLIEDLIEYFEEIYDASFYNVYVPDLERYAHVSVNGNREIRMYRNAEATVMVEFRDLNVYNPLEL